MKIRIGQGLDFTSKSWLSPKKLKKIEPHIFLYDHSVVHKVLKAYRKIFMSIENKLWNVVTIIHPSDVYKCNVTHLSGRIQSTGYPVR